MREPTEAEIRKFRRAAKALAELGREGFHIYLEEDHLNLMVGPSHDDGGSPNKHHAREMVTVPLSGGGGW